MWVHNTGTAARGRVFAAFKSHRDGLGEAGDAGYLMPAVGMPVNAGAALLKTAFKRIPPETVKALFRMADTGLESMQRLYEYIARLPRAPGATALEHGAAGVVRLLESWERILRSPLRFSPTELAASQDFLARRLTKVVSAPAAEGIAGILKYAEGGEGTLLAVQARIAGEVSDDSVESIADAAGKTLRRNPSEAGVPDALDLQRTNEALATALKRQASVYDGTIESFLGASHIIKSREEFDVLRHMRGEDLTQDQVVALNTIRAIFGTPAVGTPIRRIVKMEGLHGAIAMVADGNPNLARWFSRADELDGLTSAADFAQALRIQGLDSVQAFAILESKVTASMANDIKLPLTGRYHELSQSSRKYDFMVDEGNSPNFPNTNNAQIPSLDKKYRTENYLPGSGSPMLADGQTTVLRFRLNNGTTPHRVPIPVDGEIVEASDWALIPHPSLPGQFKWIPIE